MMDSIGSAVAAAAQAMPRSTPRRVKVDSFNQRNSCSRLSFILTLSISMELAGV
jgi:hypothetical protein